MIHSRISVLLLGALMVCNTSYAKKTKSVQKTDPLLEQLKLVEGDEKGNEIKALKAELLVSASEDLAIKQAKQLIKKHKGTHLEPDLLFRLAELYMRKAKTDRFFEIHRQSETLVRLLPRQVTTRNSVKTVKEALVTYGRIVSVYPKYSQMDLVIFNYAFAHQSLAQDTEAEALYWKLVTNFPNSSLVPDAHLAIGEIAFEKGRFAHALTHFNAIQKYPKSRVYPYGLYKAAWTHYNLRDAKAGLKKLEEVVKFGEYVEANNIESRLDLRKEALLDMTLFFTEVYPSSDAYAYFSTQSGKLDVSPIIMRLAELYQRYSRYQDLNTVLHQFISKRPNSDLLPDAYNRLIVSYEHLKNRPEVLKHLEAFYASCQPDSAWTKGFPQGKAPVCTEKMFEQALTHAQKWLRIFNKNPHDPSYADHSEKAFEIFLRSGKKDKEYNEAKYLYAELLFKRQKYRQASVEYASISGLPGAPGAGGKQLNHDASYAAVLSLEKAVGDKWSDADELTFHKLAESYVSQNPKGKYRLDIEFKMGLLAYEKERYDEAAPIFLRLGQTYAGQEKGFKAQDLYLDILNIKKDYAGIKSYTSSLIKMAGPNDRKDRLQKLYEESFFMQVQILEEQGKNKEAIQGYVAFLKQNPSSALAEKAAWNSTQLYYKSGDLWSGAEAGVSFAEKYPQSKESIGALVKSARTYEDLAQLSPAAKVLSALSQRDEKDSVKWMELSADFYAMSGQYDHARKLYDQVSRKKSPKEIGDFLMKMESFEKNYGSKATTDVVRNQIISRGVQPASNLAQVAKIESTLERGDLNGAFNDSRRALAQSGWTNAEKARIRFVQAKVLVDEFMKQSVKAKAERIAVVLAIKTEKLEKAQQALQASIKYGDPSVAVKASKELYNCYDHYVTALKTMPTPAGLGPDDEAVFRSEIQNLIIPLEEKSVDTLSEALKFARKNKFMDGSIQELEREMASVNKQQGQAAVIEITSPKPVIPVWKGASL